MNRSKQMVVDDRNCRGVHESSSSLIMKLWERFFLESSEIEISTIFEIEQDREVSINKNYRDFFEYIITEA